MFSIRTIARALGFFAAIALTPLLAQNPYDVVTYPRFPNLTGLTAINVSTDGDLTSALGSINTATHYIKCNSGANFSATRTISKSGTASDPLIIIGHQTGGSFTNRAKFVDWTVTGANVWICALKAEGANGEFALSIIGAADNATVTQCWFDGRRGMLVNSSGGQVAQGVRIGWNRFTGNTTNFAGGSFIGFEVGLSDNTKPENARIYRNLIESTESGLTDESMCIINRPGRNPDENDEDYLTDFIVLENWIKSGRRRGVYLKHGGEIVRNVCELEEGSGLVFALRGRGTRFGKMLGNIGKKGASVVVQGEFGEILGNDFSDVPKLNLFCKYQGTPNDPDSVTHGATGGLISKNKGDIYLGRIEGDSIKLADLANVDIEEHDGLILTNTGAAISWDGNGHPTGTVPNVNKPTITKRATATVPIPSLATVTQSTVGPGAPALPTNLLVNPGFENGTTGWTGFQCTIAADTTDKFSGTASCKATARNANYEGAEQDVFAIIDSAAAGYTIRATAKFKSTSGTAGDAKLVLIIEKAGGNQFITLAQALGISSANGWATLNDQSYTLQAADLSGMTGARLSVRFTNGTANYFVDDVELRLVP